MVEVELPWAEHGFDFVPGGLGAQIAFGTIVRFLEREIGPGTATAPSATPGAAGETRP